MSKDRETYMLNFLPNYEQKIEQQIELKCVKCDSKFKGVKYDRWCNPCKNQIRKTYWGDENYVPVKKRFTTRD